MARAVQLDLFEGDLDGVFQKLYIAYSENGNFFEIEPHCLSWKTLANKSQIPDFQETKYKHVDTTRMQKLHEFMEIKKTWDIDDIVAENKAYIKEVETLNQNHQKPSYIKETFQVSESTNLTDMKVGVRTITHTKLTDIKGQEVLLVSKSDAYGHYRKIAEGEIVTATYHHSDMNEENGQRIMKAINVQNARKNEYEAFMKKEPYPIEDLSMSLGRK